MLDCPDDFHKEFNFKKQVMERRPDGSSIHATEGHTLIHGDARMHLKKHKASEKIYATQYRT